ncbi:MAG: purine-nucleoside phosphorylase [Kofleriaceae bacterium]
MATIHIAAAPGDIADTILMPGDPKRAEWIAQRYLESPQLFNNVRGMLGFTGTRHRRRLSVMAHGMGMPSLAIYAHELITHYGVKTLIRVGSCGSLQPSVRLRDVVIAQAASTDSSWQDQYELRGHFAPCASWELLSRAAAAADQKAVRAHVGGVLSTDVFYTEGEHALQPWIKLGVLAAEMETAALYMLGARHGARTLALLTVSDEIWSGNHISSEDREQTFTEMMAIALAVV